MIPPHWIMLAQQIDEETAEPEAIQQLALAEPEFVVYIAERARAKITRALADEQS